MNDIARGILLGLSILPCLGACLVVGTAMWRAARRRDDVADRPSNVIDLAAVKAAKDVGRRRGTARRLGVLGAWR